MKFLAFLFFAWSLLAAETACETPLHDPKAIEKCLDLALEVDDPDKAIEYLKKTLEAAKKQDSDMTDTIAHAYHELSKNYALKGDYQNAIEAAKKAYHYAQKAYGPKDNRTFVAATLLAMELSTTAQYSQALDILKDLQRHFENPKTDEERKILAMIHNNITLIYRKIDDPDSALKHAFKALKIFEDLYGKEHPDTAAVYNNIGLLYWSMGKLDLAQKYYQTSLEIKRKILPPDHHDIYITIGNLGALAYEKGDYTQALKFFTEAFSYFEKRFGPHHHTTASFHYNLGITYEKLGEPQKALHHLEKAKEILEPILGPEHPDMRGIYEHLSNVYHTLGDKRKGDLYRKKVERLDKIAK